MAFFTEEQQRKLDTPVPKDKIESRRSGGQDFDYVSIDFILNVANEIFEGRWESRLRYRPWIELEVTGKDRNGNPRIERLWGAEVEVSAWNEAGERRTHSSVGYSLTYGDSLELVQHGGKKAETDAIKRCLYKFGQSLGLSLRMPIEDWFGTVEDGSEKAAPPQPLKGAERRAKAPTRSVAPDAKYERVTASGSPEQAVKTLTGRMAQADDVALLGTIFVNAQELGLASDPAVEQAVYERSAYLIDHAGSLDHLKRVGEFLHSFGGSFSDEPLRVKYKAHQQALKQRQPF